MASTAKNGSNPKCWVDVSDVHGMCKTSKTCTGHTPHPPSTHHHGKERKPSPHPHLLILFTGLSSSDCLFNRLPTQFRLLLTVGCDGVVRLWEGHHDTGRLRF